MGAAKSGTTALYFKIRNSLQGSIYELFETDHLDSKASADAHHILAKLLFRQSDHRDLTPFSGFEKKIGIVRDPRDRLISGVLYNLFHSDLLQNNLAAREQLLALLEHKEREPQSTSLRSLLQSIQSLLGKDLSPQWTANKFLQCLKNCVGFFYYKYEDFVAERFSALEDYLGFPLRGENKVDACYQRVIRTKASGNWKNWFLQEDVEFFRPMMKPYLDFFGYEDDWNVSQNPVISPTHSSLYVRNLLAERRAINLLAAEDQEIWEALSASEALIDAFRTEFGPVLARHALVGERYDHLLSILHTLRFYFAPSGRLHQKFVKANDANEKADYYHHKLALTTAKLEKNRAQLAGALDECKRLKKKNGLKRLLFWRHFRPPSSL